MFEHTGTEEKEAELVVEETNAVHQQETFEEDVSIIGLHHQSVFYETLHILEAAGASLM